MLRDPDSNPYSLLEGEGELADADISEGMGGDRRRRSRRRRNDQEPSVMDAAAESDSQAGPSENGLGEHFCAALSSVVLSFAKICCGGTLKRDAHCKSLKCLLMKVEILSCDIIRESNSYFSHLAFR